MHTYIAKEHHKINGLSRHVQTTSKVPTSSFTQNVSTVHHSVIKARWQSEDTAMQQRCCVVYWYIDLKHTLLMRRTSCKTPGTLSRFSISRWSTIFHSSSWLDTDHNVIANYGQKSALDRGLGLLYDVGWLITKQYATKSAPGGYEIHR